jgi:Arc/MetJ-type ribon-helix-helix transcriptional regulator
MCYRVKYKREAGKRMETMKQSISVTVERDLVEWIDKQVQTQKYRNRSHLVELALVMFRKKDAGASD